MSPATPSPSASSRERGRRWWAPLLIVAVLCAACGTGDDDAAPVEDTTTTSVTTTTTGAPTTTETGPTTTAPPTTGATAPTTTTVPPVETTTTGASPTGPAPAWPLDFPDPFVLVGDDGNHAYATSSGFVQVPRLDSPTLAEWTGPSEAFPTRAEWAVVLSVWAPALLALDDRYLLYYTAKVTGTDRHCISVAESATPEGPFVDTSTEPLLCPEDQGGAIDPSPFVDTDGSVHLLWKNDGITLRRDSSIWSQRLTDDGRVPVGDPVRLIGTDQDWEFPHVEAPSMLRWGDSYWLAYSGNWWNQDAYGIGFARCASPTGPCEKPFDQPIVASAAGAWGPGGAELFVDRDGRSLLAYHAWLDEPGYPGHRALWIDAVDLGGDVPVVRHRSGG